MLPQMKILAKVGMVATALMLTTDAKEYKGYKFKGEIIAIEGNALTLQQEMDEPVSFVVTTDTEITRDERPATLDELQADDVAIVTAKPGKGGMVAVRIFAMEPE